MALDKALEYAIKYLPRAMGALDDCWLPLDNNLAERGIKPFVTGRNYVSGAAMRRAVPRPPPACTRSWSQPRPTA